MTGYLSDLGGLLGKDVARAHTVLECLIGQITLKPGEKGLYATFRGNVEGILRLEGVRDPFVMMKLVPGAR